MDKVPKVCLVVDAETLCKVLGEAEDWDKKAAMGAKTRLFKRNWREMTPPEELGRQAKKRSRVQNSG